uniref:Uncharacterized protein n=1 Tax=Acrobeloides nanus TaxID=290746 RepID=A0A914DME9_9BILA
QILRKTNEISEKLDKLQTSMSINTIITETYEEYDDECDDEEYNDEESDDKEYDDEEYDDEEYGDGLSVTSPTQSHRQLVI